MGMKEIYTCDDCGTKDEFWPGTDVRNLTKGGWLVISGIGGCGVYCPKCKLKHDPKIKELERFGKLIDPRSINTLGKIFNQVNK